MYLKKIRINNVGPIQNLNLECQFDKNNYPAPIVVVGKNGSGKSIALAHVVNALILAHSFSFDDSDVEKGSVYKLRSSKFISYGADHSVGEVDFDNEFFVSEIQLKKEKNEYINKIKYKFWDQIPEADLNYLNSNINLIGDKIKNEINDGVYMFFPSNRFEDPIWINELNLKNKVNYTHRRKYLNISNKPIINYSGMDKIQNWLLDVIYDSHVLEKQSKVVYGIGQPQLVESRVGSATNILSLIENIIRELFGRSGNVRWNIGRKGDRSIGISINGDIVTDNLFGLSTGQIIILDIFLGIIMQFDLGDNSYRNLNEITGIVVIDEIDLHIHIELQHDLIPDLIKLFPKVQFIITTHSPLFVMGMEKAMGCQGMQILNMPSGSLITGEKFSEFESAYSFMERSDKFQSEIQRKINEAKRPILYLEGSTDILYLRKAADYLGEVELLSKFDLFDAGGVPFLNKIWDTYKSNLNCYIIKKWILMYDCDEEKKSENVGKLYRRTIPQQEGLIARGIENLFPDSVIEVALKYKSAFIDITDGYSETIRGAVRQVQKSYKVNKDEKKNLCDWICANGDESYYSRFFVVFDMIREVIDDGL